MVSKTEKYNQLVDRASFNRLCDDDKLILSDLFERIISFFSNEWDTKADIKIDKIEARELSVVSYFTVIAPGKRQKCLLKIAKIADCETKIKNEYEALQLLYPIFKKNHDYQVPKPLLAFPDKSAIVVEAYPFPSLHFEMRFYF